MGKPEIRVKLKGKQYSKPIKVPSYANPNQVAIQLRRNLRDMTPRDTGKAMRNYYKTDSSNGNKVVRNDVEYVQYLEDGSSKQAPNGFVDQAIKKTRREMRAKSPNRRRR